MIEKNKLKWIYVVCGIFILLNTFFITNEFYWFVLFPLIILIILLFFFSLDKLLLLLAFLTPLSINFKDISGGFGLTIPTEPLLFGMMLFFILKLIYDKKYDIKIFRHPVTIALFINLFWMLITLLTSELFGVSFKYFIARLWFISAAFFLGVPLFKEFKNIGRFIWLYILAFVIVIFYTTINHSMYGFSEKTGHWVMSPFYNDHTAYGAMLAFFIPLLGFFSFNSKYKKRIRVFSFLTLGLFLVAFVLSYCRAAWLSLLLAMIIWLFTIFKIRMRWILLSLLFLIGLFFIYQDTILQKMEKNKQASSTDFIKHVQSVSNISTDASNLERINRWNSAIKMFKERPIFGWGPGTYQFIYGPFQASKDKTIISTSAGDRGNAHSEYIGPLAESGVLGTLTFILIIIYVVITVVRIFRKTNNRHIRRFTLALFMGLITYCIHGFLNNFLDSDKASIPFWGFIAMIVAIDLYHSSGMQNDSKTNV